MRCGLSKRFQRCVTLGTSIAALVLIIHLIAPAWADERPRLSTHESLVNDILATTELPLGDPRAMFAFVLKSFGDRVKVYPTENYYYFRFVHRGIGYSGNIRLAARDRDEGKVHFAYFENFRGWKSRPMITHTVLDRVDGVTSEKLAPFLYRVSYQGKTVDFQLNDLSGVAPPASTLGPNETFLGPIFDDSAIRFFLIYNRRIKSFLYLLDETASVPDELVPVQHRERILIGKRTGFAFYRDQFHERKILIGVFADNARDNNHLDGPFDQLPDNFIQGDMLRESILKVDPKLAGKIDRFGGFFNGSGRYLIAPYLHYRRERDLAVFDRCAMSKRTTPEHYYACFVVGLIDGKGVGRKRGP
jgi:hypothetical protein